MSENIEPETRSVAELKGNDVFEPNFGIPLARGKVVKLFFAPHPDVVNRDGMVEIISVEQVPNEGGGYSSRVTMLIRSDTQVKVMPDNLVVSELTRARKRINRKGFGFVPDPNE